MATGPPIEWHGRVGDGSGWTSAAAVVWAGTEYLTSSTSYSGFGK